jgi:hypothetical protein
VLPACKTKPEQSTASQTQTEASTSPPQTQPGNTTLPTQSNELYLFRNDWLDKDNIYVYGQPPLDYLRAVNATGVTWSVYWAGLTSQDQNYVETLHQNGFKVASSLPTVQGDIDLVRGDSSLLERASCRDIQGEISYLSWVSEKSVYFMCHNNPEWQEFLKTRIKENIDGGADAIQIDEIEGTGGHLDIAGFCEYCLKGFRLYLGERYSAAELRDRFGIENIDSFDYRSYLRANNANTVWEDPNQDLLHEYLNFQYSSRLTQINDLIKYARDYAGRDILFSANVYGLSPNLQIYIPLLDFLVAEIPIGSLPEGKQFARYLLSDAIDPSKPFIAFPDIHNLASLSADDWRLWRHWLAEAYACGASFLLPYQAYTYGGGAFTLPAEKMADYTDFITAHADLYLNVTPPADVAVLYSLESTLLDWSAWENYLNLGRVLQEVHVPFQVIFNGDNQLFPTAINSDTLAKYQILVIPPGHYFDATTELLLEQYSQNGGKIIRLDTPAEISDIYSLIESTGFSFKLTTDASGNLGITLNKKDNVLIAHIINYNYDYAAHDFTPEKNVTITFTLPADFLTGDKVLRLLSPDSPEKTLDYTLEGNRLSFILPEVYIYSILLFE